MNTRKLRVMASAKRNELAHRLPAGRCELRTGTGGLEIHRVRRLADLNKPGRRESPRAAATLAMFLAYSPRRAMMASLTSRGREPAGCRWMASVTAQRSIREPCLVTWPRITLVSDS